MNRDLGIIPQVILSGKDYHYHEMVFSYHSVFRSLCSCSCVPFLFLDVVPFRSLRLHTVCWFLVYSLVIIVRLSGLSLFQYPSEYRQIILGIFQIPVYYLYPIPEQCVIIHHDISPSLVDRTEM